MFMTHEKLAKMIDYTILKPEATKRDVSKLCEEAKNYRFASVCVSPTYVSLASDLLVASDVKVCTVVGFPMGFNTSEVKAFEARTAVEKGARELDMVINIGALKSKDYNLVMRDIEKVVSVAKGSGEVLVKCIIECCLPSDEEKVKACLLAKQAGADYVKTSTGFASGGATKHDVKLMRETVGENMGVKASGGIRNLKDALTMIEAGATRIGTSTAVQVIQELSKKNASVGS